PHKPLAAGSRQSDWRSHFLKSNNNSSIKFGQSPSSSLSTRRRPPRQAGGGGVSGIRALPAQQNRFGQQFAPVPRSAASVLLKCQSRHRSRKTSRSNRANLLPVPFSGISRVGMPDPSSGHKFGILRICGAGMNRDFSANSRPEAVGCEAAGAWSRTPTQQQRPAPSSELNQRLNEDFCWRCRETSSLNASDRVSKEQDSYFNTLERKEASRAKLATITERKVRVADCAPVRSEVCKDCKQTTFTFGLPLSNRAVPPLRRQSYEKTSFATERKGPTLERDVLLARGEERKFVDLDGNPYTSSYSIELFVLFY
uniref:Mcm10 domain-containing protein n=1 Tax=Macrostomum lignano TaxID=282301 RepID=A0A1I8FI50_9PLAT